MAGRCIIDIYEYRDPRGRLVYELLRYLPKGFAYRRPGGKVCKGIRPLPQLLYRLPELLVADPAQTVYWVEGERDVESVRRVGLVATSQPGGCESPWSPRYAQWLKGRLVVILPDNDRPGQRHAERVADALDGVAASVRIVCLPGLPPKGDVSDWLAAGGTPEALARLSADTPERRPRVILEGSTVHEMEKEFYAHLKRRETLQEVLGLPDLLPAEKLLLVLLYIGIIRPKLTQRELARMMGVSARRVKQIVAGLRERGILTTRRLQRFDGRDVDTRMTLYE